MIRGIFSSVIRDLENFFALFRDTKSQKGRRDRDFLIPEKIFVIALKILRDVVIGRPTGGASNMHIMHMQHIYLINASSRLFHLKVEIIFGQFWAHKKLPGLSRRAPCL